MSINKFIIKIFFTPIFFKLIWFWFVFFIFYCNISIAQNPSKNELKGAFIANFIKFITWQNEASIDVFTIGVYTQDSMECSAFKNMIITKGKTSKIICIQSINEIGNFNVLYVNEQNNSEINQILKIIKNKNILLITENNKIETSMINFIVEKNFLRYEMNETNLTNAKFVVNPKLYTMAKTNAEFKDLYLKTEKLLEIEKQTVANQKLELEKQKEEINIHKQIIENQKNEIASQYEKIEIQQKKIEEQKSESKKFSDDIDAQMKILSQKNEILKIQENKIKSQEKEMISADDEIQQRLKELDALTISLERQKLIMKKQEEEINNQKNYLNEYNKKFKAQRNIIFAAIAFIVLILIIIVQISRSYKIKKDANLILAEKNMAINQQNEEILQQRDNLSNLNNQLLQNSEEIIQQKQILEKINNELESKNKELEKLSIVARETDNAIIIFSYDGKFEWANEGYKRLYGYSLEEIQLKQNKSFAEVSNHPDAKKILRQCYISKQAILYDHKFIDKTGNTKWIQTTLTPILNSKGFPKKFVAIETDITQLKLVEKELENLNKTLENRIKEEVQNNRNKDLILTQQSRQAAMGEMIGNIAHQWRQPLNAVGIIIQNFEEAFEYGELTEKYIKERIIKAMDLIQYMSKTIDDFRNFFKPEKQKQQFNAYEILLKAISFLEANFKNLNITISMDAEKDVSVFGFPNEYAQVIINVLNNAKDALLEHKIEKPKIDIELKLLENQSRLIISDNAGGIPENIIDKIFEPYFSTKEANKGTGLGLYMSKTIIEKNMDGVLAVKNNSNGAAFTIIV